MNILHNQRRTLIAAGLLIGMAGAGFFDGIVFHELLQWHHLISSIRPATTLENLHANMIGDGLFHAATYLLAVSGISLLWRVASSGVRLPSKIFSGSLLLGAGLFNLMEGLIDHQILGIHHLKPGINQLAWDLGFLGAGVVLAVIGWLLLRTQEQIQHFGNISSS
ncbi:MAG: DUF2243 domain-containing protein [Actinomycetota bacterium]